MMPGSLLLNYGGNYAVFCVCSEKQWYTTNSMGVFLHGMFLLWYPNVLNKTDKIYKGAYEEWTVTE